MTFRPIAIVGQACVLPGAATPDALWDAVISRRDLLAPVPPGRWRMDGDLVVAPDPSDTRDHIVSNRAGVVTDFVFSPDGLRLPADVLAPLDPLCHWLLHTGREALRTARVGREERGGAIFGNLSFPSDGLSCFAESVWLHNSGLPPVVGPVTRENRFMSGLPAHILANALGLEAGVLALDAACASSLYAMQVACTWLSTGRADVMLAGGVNRAEMLFLQMGFTALTALSPTGRSRPFHREADGLVPAEGAALIALRRLDDAVRRKDNILGVIRGIGLSNDGRSEGVLIPASDGQVRAMRRAYEVAGLSPADISLVECHAPGTHIGDGIEVASLSRVFEGCSGVGIGSVKSNLGHLITAAGAAAVIKVLGAMKAETLPPTLHADDPLPNIAGSPLRLLHDAEPWNVAGLRRAAVSGFGFGGNNSHVIVEEWREQRSSFPVADVATPPADLAIVGIGAVVANTTGVADFTRALLDGESRLQPAADGSLRGAATDVVLPLKGLRFPPRDLEQTLPQQLAVLQAALEAVGPLGDLPHDRTSVLVGMQTDGEIARYGMRWRLESWCREWTAAGAGAPEAEWLTNARQDVVPPLQAAGVIGTMPNIPANRINRQLDLRGPSYTVSAEELSGIRALEIAAQALHDHDIDVAIVGAVDLSCEDVQIAAMPDVTPGDAAIVLVIKRLEQARRDGDRVYAVLPAVDHGHDATLTIDVGARGTHSALTSQFGHAHACSGLLHIAAAALACHHRMAPDAPSAARPWLPTPDGRIAEVRVGALGGQHAVVMLQSDPASSSTIPSGLATPSLTVYGGRDRAGVIAAIDARRSENVGPARLVLVADAADQIEPLRSAARDALRTGSPLPPGAYFHERPIGGEMAFVFSGPGGAYHGMGRDLLLAAPELVDGLSRLITRHRQAAGWLYQPDSLPTPTDKLWGSSYLTQVHAQLTRKVLGLRPTAAIGFCSGETNALFAMGAWSDMDAFHQQVSDSGIFTREIGGEHLTVRRAWKEADPIRWTSWQVLAPENTLRDLLVNEPRVHLAIINAPGNFVISGDADGCDRVLGTLGTHRARPLNYDLCTHCPETSAFFDEWRALHHRPTAPVPGVRFYTHATIDSYQPTDDSAADALVGQFSRTVDFPRLVQKAWDDGVRVFLEHGPVGSCSRWIDQILGDREHVSIPLDTTTRSSWQQVWHAIGRLVAAGVEVPGLDGWIARTSGDASPASSNAQTADGGPMLRLPAHPPAIRLAPLPVPIRNRMPAASMASAAGQRMTAPPRSPLAIAIRPDVAVAGSPSRTTVAFNEPEPLQTFEVPDLHAQFLRTIQQMGRVHQQYVDTAEGAYQSLLSSWPASHGVSEQGFSPYVEAPLPPVDDRAQQPTERPEPSVDSSADAPQTPRDRDVAPVAPAALLPGPKFSRAQLEWLASREVSAVLGDLFKRQDGFARQVRMPEPPLLLADRVTGIDATPGVLGEGTIWTETDVTEDAWYLHAGHMTPGVMIEAGQADLLLVSWMGADFLNQGRRVYRLLGCQLTFRGHLAHIGDTCAYDIHIDGHADHGDVRIFFFHSDCRIGDDIRLSVRGGQAGFFTDEELAASAGVLWDPAAITLPPGRVDPPLVPFVRGAFTAAEVRAFSEGRAFDCFGRGYELAQTHTRTPTISAGRMQLFDEVTHLDLTGGPWGRGYLRAEQHLHPDDWFLKGHFKNDPCMPGTLMFDGCMQTMAFYLAALGTTIEHDAWRFEPVSDETFTLRCRGQATPASRLVVYELFVREVITGPVPTLRADLLCTVDGMKAFHCEAAALNLVPDWPLSSMPALLRSVATGRPAAEVDGFRFDERAMLACAWGRPEDAFGPRFKVFDGVHRRTGHLPGPPYFLMTRVTKLDAVMGDIRPGSSLVVEYDVPPDAFYFVDNPSGLMPFGVLMEIALQPCGWLATFLGITLKEEQLLFFRNLDGDSFPTAPIPRTCGTIRTHVTCTNISASGGMTIESFKVECFVGDTSVYKLDTVFGHFPKASLDSQVGMPRTPEEKAWIVEPNDFLLNLRETPIAGLATGQMLMIDRIDGWWPTAGAAGLGRMRAVKDMDPGAWFFKAHFYYDPVQPGSLGVQAMIQTIQAYAIHTGLAAGMTRPVFEDAATGRKAVWKYRGQVNPFKKRVVIEMEAKAVEREGDTFVIIADAYLWADGLCIYKGVGIAVRLFDAGPDLSGRDAGAAFEVSAASDPWVTDHCPAYVLERPALPAMWMLDRLAQAASAHAPGLLVTAVHDLRIHRWLIPAPDPLMLRTRVEDVAPGIVRARLETLVGDSWEAAATARLTLAPHHPPAPAPLASLTGDPSPNPYETGRLFHGPAFQLLTRLITVPGAASSILDAGKHAVPRGMLHPALLDASLHGIPHDDLGEWDPALGSANAGYPHTIESATFHGPTPSEGSVRCETRMVASAPFPTFHIQILAGDRVWAEIRLREVLLPKGRLGMRPGPDRVRFLRDRQYVAGMSLSRVDGEVTRLSDEEVAATDWLPGTVAALYGSADAGRIVALEHVGRHAHVHPSRVRLDGHAATAANLPLNQFFVSSSREGRDHVASDEAPESLDLSGVRAFWQQRLGFNQWILFDLYFGLVQRFVRRLVFADPDTPTSLASRPAVYLSNHQVQVESLLFPILMGAVTGVPISTVARREHQAADGDLRADTYWLGPLVAHTESYPGFRSWRPITFFDQSDPSSMLSLLENHRRQASSAPHSLFVHVQGTRAQSSRDRVTQLSASLLDMALALDAPVVPVWLGGGLPAAAVAERLDFPVGYGRQDYVVGRPIEAAALKALPYAKRRELVMHAINALATSDDPLTAGDRSLAHQVERLAPRGVTPVQAVMLATLAGTSPASAETRQVLERIEGGRAGWADDDRGRWLETVCRWLSPAAK